MDFHCPRLAIIHLFVDKLKKIRGKLLQFNIFHLKVHPEEQKQSLVQTITPLLTKVTNNTIYALGNKMNCVALFIDFSMSCDTVNHN